MSILPELETVIIGGGPAGLTCAVALRNMGYSHSIALIDCGRDYKHRFCPVDHGGLCSGCGGICNVIAGFGGSIHYGDGLKLSNFPSGRRLAETIGSATSHAAIQQSLDILFDGAPPEFKLPDRAATTLSIKDYPLICLSAREVQDIVESLARRVLSDTGTELDLHTYVTAIDPINGGFEILANGPHGSPKRIRAKKVVVAVGRKGFLWWREEIRRIGLDYGTPISSLGFRFECPTELMGAAAACHPDYKTTVFKNELKFKTFCFCSGNGGGRVKYADYGPFTLLDGHVIVEPASSPTRSNFALLMQLLDRAGKPLPFEQINANFILPYQKLNPARPGKPIAQVYSDFARKKLSFRTLEDIRMHTGLSSGLNDLAVNRIDSLLDPDIHETYCAVFEELVAEFANMAGHHVDVSRVTTLALELEGLWDEIRVTRFMESSIPGLFVAGDCAGIAQGVLQAAVGGVQVATAISKS